MPQLKAGGRRRKAAPNTYWRGDTLYLSVKVRGKLVRHSLRTDDVEIARARAQTEIERLKAAAFYGDHRMTYQDVVVAWGENILHQVGPATARRYAVSLRQLEPWLVDAYLDEVTRKKVTELVDERRAAGVTTATIRRDLSALSNVLAFAIDQEWRAEDDNPAFFRLKRLKERRKTLALPERAHIERVIAAAPPRIAPIIVAALKTGCRLDELVTAERGRLDHTRRQLTVRGKGSKLRTIDLDYEGGYEALRGLPVRIGCKWLFWQGDGMPLRGVSERFHELVARVHADAQKEAQGRGLAECDFRPFRFHDLRHRHAVDWLKAGRSIYDLQKRLGHTSVKTTEIYLVHLTPEEARAAMYAESQIESQVERSGAQ